MSASLLTVEDLAVYFPVKKGLFKRTVGNVKAVDGISFTIGKGETLGLVGESGCGKTTTGRAIVKLEKKTRGMVRYKGEEYDIPRNGDRKAFRRKIQMIFQDPFSSLDPKMTIGEIIQEPVKFHFPGMNLYKRTLELMDLTGLPRNFEHRYAHECSGGQRQRVGIARALAVDPGLIICDEPVSALDVSLQSQIINLLNSIQKELGVSYLFVAHDLAVVKHISHRIAVMYLGTIVELCESSELYAAPRHPYTKALINSIPVPDLKHRGEIQPIGGEIPSPLHAPAGCPFSSRCPYAKELCTTSRPKLETVSENHTVACHFWKEI